MSHKSLTAEWAVAQMVENGASFSEIEDYIDGLSLTGEQKSVLWLWAWAELPRVTRHKLMPLDSEDCAETDRHDTAQTRRPKEQTRRPTHAEVAESPLSGWSLAGLLRLLRRK